MTEKWDSDAPKGRDERIIWEAKKRFRRCVEWESEARANYVDDMKFANGDSINNWQWPDNVLANRQQPNMPQQPCLTINKTRQHNLQIINDARQNKSSVKVVAVGDGATMDAAQVFMGIIRHIENVSNAQDAYDNARYHQVNGGIGYWRILTDYAHDGTFDQEIYIRRVPNPLSVYLDPDIQEADGSDARYGFVFVDQPRDEFENENPKVDVSGPGIDAQDDWVRKDTVRKAEYYRKVETSDTLYLLIDGSTVTASELSGQGVPMPPAEAVKQSREVPRCTIEHYTLAGNEIIDRKVWPSRYVPIVRVVGEETVIGGKMDRKGHTRALRDPQRMYNYWSSAATEHVALQSKIPYIADPEAIEGYETYWETANTQNHAYLPYKSRDGNDNELRPPVRLPPPVMPDAYLKGLQTTAQEMMMVSGQYQAEMGAPSNERSGVAIERRQRQADNSTYHFVNREGQAIRFTGKILLDLIPHIYDVPRTVRILGEDGTEDHVQVEPNAPQAHQEQQSPDPSAKAAIIFNPNVGNYAVEADIGPAFATQRQEGFQALTQVMSANKEMAPFIADIWMKMGDFPGADEIAKRLRAMVPPAALVDGDPAIQGMQQRASEMIGQAEAAVKQLTAQLAEAKSKTAREDEKTVIEAFRAETDRLTAIQPQLTPDMVRPIFMQLMQEMANTSPIGEQPAPMPAMQAEPPQPQGVMQ